MKQQQLNLIHIKQQYQQPLNQNNMKQTAVEFLWDMLLKGEFINNPEELLKQAKAKEISQKAKEYLKGFNDGKEFKKKLDELTFKSE